MDIDDKRVAQILEAVEGLVRGDAPEALDLDGDDDLAKLAAGLDRLVERRAAADRALFSRGPVVVFRWRNEEGWPVEFVSPNVEQLTGYPTKEFASGRLPYASLIHADDLAQVFQEVTDNSGSAEWFEHLPYRIRHANGDVLWVYDYTVVLRDDEGKATHFYGYIMDISDRLASDQKIRDQLALIENLGAPILQVWDGVLAIPLLGLLDDDRATRVTEALLDQVSTGQAKTAILDFTGVDVLDTSTAQHLGRLVRAVGLLGCECVITGLSPAVAQTVVSLGIDFEGVRIFRTLAVALRGVVSQR